VLRVRARRAAALKCDCQGRAVTAGHARRLERQITSAPRVRDYWSLKMTRYFGDVKGNSRSARFGVTTCESAAEMLECAKDTSADLLISDIGMPEIDGFE